jgi:dipeptidyl aminopeptidase/acylaminoacyl peptidase
MSGDPRQQLSEKYERQGWPAEARPDLRPPSGWSHGLLLSVDRPRNHSLSPDGKRLAYFWDRADASDLYLVATSGGWPRRLTFDRGPTAYWDDDPPQWSPNGRWLAFTQDEHVWIISSEGGQPVRISDFTTNAGSPRWHPDSEQLLITTKRAERTRIVLTDRLGSWPRPVSNGPGHDSAPEVSPDGSRVAYLHTPVEDLGSPELMLADLHGREVRRLAGTSMRRILPPRWSPDGARIAYVAQRPDYHELYLLDPQSGQERQLTTLGQDLGEIAWSPDGTRILCTPNRRGSLDLAWVSVESGEVRFLRQLEGVHSRPQWAPDGRAIVFGYQDPTHPRDHYQLELESGQLTQLTFSMPPALERLALVQPQQVEYRSLDGRPIPAFLIRPSTPNGAAVLYAHGGPTSQFIQEFDLLAQYFVAKGYTWLAPNFRGSTGYGVEFEHLNHGDWGAGDTQDCLAGADYLASLDGIQPKRIGIFGPSYGSYLAVCSLAFDPQHRFACGVAKYGDCNIETSWAQSSQSVREDQERMMGTPAVAREATRRGSPIWQVDNIQRPLLIVHGLQDRVVHPLQSEELVEGLKRLGKTFEYKTYADEGHGLFRRKNLLDFHQRLERFLDWHLM